MACCVPDFEFDSAGWEVAFLGEEGGYRTTMACQYFDRSRDKEAYGGGVMERWR